MAAAAGTDKLSSTVLLFVKDSTMAEVTAENRIIVVISLGSTRAPVHSWKYNSLHTEPSCRSVPNHVEDIWASREAYCCCEE